ncbi:high mobility group (HMG)-box containing transcription factor [Oopsacas minuta]|uniref:High mobility group (HMG)-box containing transcription factor n=1 Tax=Oopsacas minuta TaxID=111878 RepID=A0AAV7K0F2_9METZ|nr:high mobility group (HMG)-box containing transcription factor [Oopsacas minuta]
MSNADITKWKSESIEKFAQMNAEEKQAVSTLLQISQFCKTPPQKPDCKSPMLAGGGEERNITSMLLADENADNSDTDGPLVVDEDPPNSIPFDLSSLTTTNGIPHLMKNGDSSNADLLNVYFNTIQLEDQDNIIIEKENPEKQVNSESSPAMSEVQASPRPIPRVNSACSEEISEAFQGQFLETLRTKNDGSARRPMNAYMLFCKINRSEVKEKNPGLSNREISQILGKMWHDLDKEEWQKYTNMSFELRKAHYVAYPDFKWSKKQKRPSSIPSKRTQVEDEGGTSLYRPRSTIYPDSEYSDYTSVNFKPVSFDLNKERKLPHPSSLHSINLQPRVSGISPFLIESLLKSPDLQSTHKLNNAPYDDVTPLKKRKITPILPTDQLLPHYIVPNAISTLPSLYAPQLLPGIQQTLSNSSTPSIPDQQPNMLGFVLPMYNTNAALSSARIQFLATDPNTGYYTIHQGPLLNGKLISDS